MNLHRVDLRPALGRALAAGLAVVLVAGCVVVPAGPRYHARPAPPPPLQPAQAQAQAPMYFYPELRQTEERQDRDRYECYRWAVRETGIDPGMTPLREVPQVGQAAPPPDGSAVAGGMAAGAVVGSVLSSPRRAGEGMVLGALFGAMLGAAAEGERQRAYEQAQAREAARAQRAQAPVGNFRRAMTACMEGRGYRVQ